MRFSEFSGILEAIEKEPSRNSMVGILASLYSALSPGEIRGTTYLLQGVVEPPFKGVEFGIGEKLLIRALSISSGRPERTIVSEYQKTGDLGIVSENFSKSGKQGKLFEGQPLELSEVYSELRRLASLSGAGSQEDKVRSLAALVGRCKEPGEAKHLVRIPLSKLRLGIGDPSILDALSVSKARDKTLRTDIESAYNLCSDLGLVAETFLLKGQEGLLEIEITPGNPIRPALAERLESGEAIIGKIGPCFVDAKYDGFRAQVHKKDSRVEIFSRSLERTTDMFPEISEAVRRLPERELIIEGEAIGIDQKTGKFLPFQDTIQRKRKHGIEEARESLPLVLFAFDILYLEGIDYTKLPFKERRKKLEELVRGNGGIRPSNGIFASTGEEIDDFFSGALSSGLEGIIAKKLDERYVAGARKFAWVKLKKSYTEAGLSDTVDCAIIGYFRGKGQRTEFGFGGLLVAVLDEGDGKFKSIAKVGTGFSEEAMERFGKLLEEISSKERPKLVESRLVPDFWTEPKYVVSISADEITESPIHSAGASGEGGNGLALRFPRIKGFVREDKGARDATTVSEIRSLYELQERTRKGAK